IKAWKKRKPAKRQPVLFLFINFPPPTPKTGNLGIVGPSVHPHYSSVVIPGKGAKNFLFLIKSPHVMV
ncbi:hypothetical protein ACFQ8C_36950, partial [Streptomyces sp. NPDC056503]|uniref:hypothetical protein n=1 Tax=Streptomyces sp. NPDC056503 TaxID=3345842 RepID=UPI00369C2DAC